MNNEPLVKLTPKFIENLAANGRSPSTILAYRADLEQLTRFLSNHQIATPSQVQSNNLEAFRDTLLAEKYTPKSTSRKLNAVKTFFRWLKAQGIINFDPSKEVAHPKIEAESPKFLSQLEYRALRDVVRTDARIAAMVELILQTGLRISEIANLKLEDVKDSQIQIEAYATQPGRLVALNPLAKMALDNYLRSRPQLDSLYVFVSKNGKPLAVRNIRAAVDRYMEKAQISHFSVNDLRTTFIVENLKAGVDLVTLCQAVGHKRLSTTERYLTLAGVAESGKKQKLVEL